MEEPMQDANLVGGTAIDRQRLLETLHDYLDANARFDWQKLQDIWSGAPEAKHPRVDRDEAMADIVACIGSVIKLAPDRHEERMFTITESP
jgi:hypothetical protein